MMYNTKIIDFIKNELHNNTTLFKETPFYANDPSMRKSGVLFEMTNDEIREMQEMGEDTIKLVNKYFYALTSNGMSKLELYKFQEEYLKFLQKNEFVVCLSSRQTGKTLMEAVHAANLLLHGKSVLFITKTRDIGTAVLDKIKDIYKGLPFFMKPGVQNWNQTEVSFDNGGTVQIRAASRFFGPLEKKFNTVFVSDAALIEDHQFKYVKSILPKGTDSKKLEGQLIPYDQIILSSTPNGFNHFHELYFGAEEGRNVFKPFRIKWQEVPGRDEEWKKLEIKNLGSEENFRQEYEGEFLIKGFPEENKVPAEGKRPPEPKDESDREDLLKTILDRLTKIEDRLEKPHSDIDYLKKVLNIKDDTKS